MLKKNEVLAILERGGSIHVDTIRRTARVVDVSGEWLDCCRYDVAERIEHSDGYRRRKTDWFATYYIEIDPPAEEAREDMTIEEIEENVARIVRGVIGKEKAAKMMSSNERTDDHLEVYLCHGGCCLGDAQTIQEEILAAGYFIPAQMGNAVIYVTARNPETQEQEQPAQEEQDWSAESERVRAAVAADLPGLVDEEEQNARTMAQTLQDGIEDALRAFEAAGVISNLTIEPLPAKRETKEAAQEEAAPEEPEETAQERTDRENRETCRRIAEELEAHEAGRVYRCPECGQTFECEDLDELEQEAEDWPGYVYALPCGCETTTEPEQMSIYDYFSDCLDIEYRCDARREYRSVCVMVACGGPNIYIDTESKAVELYWWGDRASYSLLPDTVEAVDAWAAEYWEVI